MATRVTRKRASTSTVEDQSDEPNVISAETDSSLSAPSVKTVPDTSAIDRQDEQIAELRRLTSELVNTIADMQAQNARNAAFNEAVQGVKLATNAVLMSPPAGAHAVEPVYGSGPALQEQQDCECECVASGCCCFEIVLEKMRATAHQIEPSDIGEIPFTVNAMETQIFAEANGSGILFPSISSFVDLRIENIMFGSNPGPWVNICQVMNRVYVKKGTTMRCPFSCQIRESDERLTEQITGAGKDEFGEASGWIDLNCCVSKIYPDVTTEVSLVYGGKGGGRIQVVIYARRVCC